MKTDMIIDLAAIKDSDVFQSRIERVKYLMLRLIERCQTGLGAWELPIMLSKEGIELSTATAGRYLKELDNDGLTIKISNKGRVITDNGRKYMESLTTELMSSYLHKSVKDAVSGSEYQDLLDIYAVRISIELEAVKLCCRNATEAEIDAIGNYVTEYEKLAQSGVDFTDVSLDFHVLIAKGTHNHFMETLLEMLIFEQKKIENSLEYLVTRKCGRRFAEQHREIYESIRQREEKKAFHFMRDHFDDIVDSMHQQLRQNTKEMHNTSEENDGWKT